MNHIAVSRCDVSSEKTWSSVSDIGREISGEILTVKSYLEVEDQYVELMKTYLDNLNYDDKSFKIVSLEDRRGQYELDDLSFSLSNSKMKFCGGDYIANDDIMLLVRLCLRDLLWIRLEANDSSYITFGHDMSIYIGSPNNEIISIYSPSMDGLDVKVCDEDPHE